MPAAAAARESSGTKRRSPVVSAWPALGSCTEWVASKQVTRPASRISAKLRMSTTRLL